jgi:hypothetical protein
MVNELMINESPAGRCLQFFVLSRGIWLACRSFSNMWRQSFQNSERLDSSNLTHAWLDTSLIDCTRTCRTRFEEMAGSGDPAILAKGTKWCFNFNIHHGQLVSCAQEKARQMAFQDRSIDPESTGVPPWQLAFLRPGAATEGEAIDHRSTEVTRGTEAKLEEKVWGITGPSLAANVCQQPLAEKKVLQRCSSMFQTAVCARASWQCMSGS